MSTRLLAAFLGTLVYAIIRYAGFGHVSLAHLPVYIMNKAVCVTAVEALLMASLGARRGKADEVRFWSGAGSQLIFVHVLLSLGILSRGYWPSFFDGDKMSLTGEAVLLMGALGAYCFWRLRSAELAPATRRTLKVLASVFVAGHLFAMGYGDTLQVQKWNGGLPPMSMLSFFIVVAGLVVFLLTREKRVAPQADGAGHDVRLALERQR
jgi:hypothetical protein